jgi:alpha-tubulin suppressor-like RCC1 family protein
MQTIRAQQRFPFPFPLPLHLAEFAVHCWGSSFSGQLGLGAATGLQKAPRKMDFGDDVALIKRIITGPNHSLAECVLEDGTSCLYGWGSNEYGQLGAGTASALVTPTRLAFGDSYKSLQASLGWTHSVVSLEHEHGYSSYFMGSLSGSMLNVHSEPYELVSLRDLKISDISSGEGFCVVLADGKAFSFGISDLAQLGSVFAGDDRLDVRSNAVLSEFRFHRVASGWGHAIGLTASGHAYSWGSNMHGQCAIGSKSKFTLPTRIALDRVIDVACGATHTLLLNDDSVWIAGSAGDGKLGTGQTQDQLTPLRLEFPCKVRRIACGVDHSAIVLDNGSVYVWGFGQHGALTGIDTQPTPQWISAVFGIDSISCGADVTFAVVDPSLSSCNLL